jgi:hypothetical protein
MKVKKNLRRGHSGERKIPWPQGSAMEKWNSANFVYEKWRFRLVYGGRPRELASESLAWAARMYLEFSWER